MNEKRTCFKCGELVPKMDTWAEIDPRTNKTVYVCDGCYHEQQSVVREIVMRVHFMERMTTLEMLALDTFTYAYRVTYHMFDDHVQNEHTISEFALSWVRDAFNAMHHMYDDLCVNATETYMDGDICNQ